MGKGGPWLVCRVLGSHAVFWLGSRLPPSLCCAQWLRAAFLWFPPPPPACMPIVRAAGAGGSLPPPGTGRSVKSCTVVFGGPSPVSCYAQWANVAGWGVTPLFPPPCGRTH